jgi:hypothetical protein
MKGLTLIALCLMACVATLDCGGEAGVGPSSSSADTMIWDVKNSCTGTIDIRFFDRTNGVVFPSNTQSYVLDRSDRQSYRLKCNTNATICLGASLKTNSRFYWGVAVDNSEGCEDCCHICDGSDPPGVNLTGC